MCDIDLDEHVVDSFVRYVLKHNPYFSAGSCLTSLLVCNHIDTQLGKKNKMMV